MIVCETADLGYIDESTVTHPIFLTNKGHTIEVPQVKVVYSSHYTPQLSDKYFMTSSMSGENLRFYGNHKLKKNREYDYKEVEVRIGS